jgi:ABC-type sulfate transport system permease subunit
MKTYPLTQAGFHALRTRLLSMGATVPDGTDGTISTRGIVLKYHFDGKQLTLSILEKPFLIPSALIWSTVDEWLTS